VGRESITAHLPLLLLFLLIRPQGLFGEKIAEKA